MYLFKAEAIYENCGIRMKATFSYMNVLGCTLS